MPYTSGFNTASGVASIVAADEGDEESRVLYNNGDIPLFHSHHITIDPKIKVPVCISFVSILVTSVYSKFSTP